MNLTTRILCTADHEPSKFHADDDTASFAINLSLEVVTSDEPGQSHRDKARDAFKSFLTKVRDVKFALVKVNGGAISVVLKNIGADGGRIIAEEKDNLEKNDAVLTWLDETTPPVEDAGPPDRNYAYWATHEAKKDAGDQQVVLTKATLSAAHKLRASHGWAAPVSHRQALTRVAADIDKKYAAVDCFILPYFEADLPPVTVDGAAVDGVQDFLYGAQAGAGAVACRATSLVADPLQQWPVHISAEGFVLADPAAARVRRLIDGFEKEAVSLLSPTYALGALREEWRDGRLNKIFKLWAASRTLDDKGQVVYGLVAPEAAFMAVAALCAALDPMVIGLVRPHASAQTAGHRAEGLVLSQLVSKLAESLQAAKIVGVDEQVLGEAIRKFLARSKLVECAGKADKTSKGAFVVALRHVHGLAETTAVTSVDEVLLELLLRIYVDPDWDHQPVKELRALLAAVNPDKAGVQPTRFRGDFLAGAFACEARLHEEANFEAALIRYFETATKDNTGALAPHDVANQLAADVIATGKLAGDASVIADAVDRAWREFVAVLKGPFNGAEAARRSANSDLAAALLQHNPVSPTAVAPNDEMLFNAISAGGAIDLVLYQVGHAPPACFDAIYAYAHRPTPSKELIDDVDLGQVLRAAQTKAMGRFRRSLDDVARFVPDQSPHPLPVQIATSTSAAETDKLSKLFNGVGVLMRRVDDGRSPFAQLNLAQLQWPTQKGKAAYGASAPSAPPDEPFAIETAGFASTDGRGLMYVDYDGFPFSSRHSFDTIPFGQEEPGQDEWYRPFYSGDAAGDDGKRYAKAPGLAYGRTFETIAFVSTNSGSLPRPLRGDKPWRPADTATYQVALQPLNLRPFIASTDYQRRTAISRISIEERSKPRRIGARYDGVQPLAYDYPRLTIGADGREKPGTLDLMRLSDGEGSLQFPAPDWPQFESKIGEETRFSLAETIVQFADPDWLGGQGLLRVDLFGPPADLVPTRTAPTVYKSVGAIETTIAAEDDLAAAAEVSLRTTRTIARDAGGNVEPPTTTFELVLRLGRFTQSFLIPDTLVLPDSVWWLRLTLTSTAATSACFSFAEPQADHGASHGMRDTPVALVARDCGLSYDDKQHRWEVDESGKGAWRLGIEKPIEAIVRAPRTGYLDFERWFANADLMDELKDRPNAVAFFDALLGAYLLRDLSPSLADGLANLPDPAVSRLRITLSVADRLGAPFDKPVVSGEIDIRGQLADQIKKFGPISKAVKLDSYVAKFGSRLGRGTTGQTSDDKTGDLDRAFEFPLKIEAGSQLKLTIVDKRIDVTVPPGVVAHISIEPLVKQEYFSETNKDGVRYPAIFHEGMRQLLRGVDGGEYVLPGTTLRIETPVATMSRAYLGQPAKGEDLLIAFVDGMIDATPIAQVRKYDLLTRDRTPQDSEEEVRRAIRSAWRIVGEIDVVTQRWRHMGRPIDAFINPREFRADGLPPDGPVSPALPLDCERDSGKFAAFERQLFFDRPDYDSQTITKTLTPLPARTNLQSHVWDAASAAYFRHRLVLRSRYAGLFTTPKAAENQTWPSSNPDDAGDEAAFDRALTRSWTKRVAILADASRLQATRPQLRALMPLTESLSVDTPPPALAILQEPPFARGGLADRIVAEVVTGFSYGFEQATDINNPEPVHILESRKEMGPDPRRVFRPLAADAAMAMTLKIAGPAGLTFDRQDAPAPAFANSIAMLIPRGLGETSTADLEEHFLGVSMRRYVDPEWTVDMPDVTIAISTSAVGRKALPGGVKRKPVEVSVVDPANACWIDLPNEPFAIDLVVRGDALPGSPADSPVFALEPVVQSWLSMTAHEGRATVSVANLVLDPVPLEDKRTTPIASFAVETVHSLVLLHQPVAPGRYTTSVLARLAARFEDSGLRTLATFEWSPRHAVGADVVDVESALLKMQAPGTWARARRVIASTATSLAWTRTGRDHKRWRMFALEKGQWQIQPVAFDQMRAQIQDGALAIEAGDNRWLCSTAHDNQTTPVHVHRHLAVVVTGGLKADELAGRRRRVAAGRPIEVFWGAAPLHGRSAPIGEGKKSSVSPERCRLIEFETPAAILTNENPLVPKTFASAYFDLKSRPPDHGVFDFHFRFVGGPAHLKTLKALKIELRSPASKDELWSGTVNLAPAPIDPRRYPLGLIVRLSDTDSTARIKWSDGDVSKAEWQSFPKSTPAWKGGGIVMSVCAALDGGEFWTDVSLLTSKDGIETDASMFRWLFSEAGDPDVAAALSPGGLQKMTEAQARVIAVSPPIPVHNER